VHGGLRWACWRRELRACETTLTQTLVEQQEGTYVEPQRMTVRAFLERWLDPRGRSLHRAVFKATRSTSGATYYPRWERCYRGSRT